MKRVATYCYQCVAGPDLLTVKVSDGATTLARARTGVLVNLEVDMLAKYMEQLLRPIADAVSVNLDFLQRNGYAH